MPPDVGLTTKRNFIRGAPGRAISDLHKLMAHCWNKTGAMIPNIITAPGPLSLLLRIAGSKPQPHLRLYHSYGDADRVLVMGHALMHPPLQPPDYKDGF